MTNSSTDMFPRPTDTLFTASDYDALAAIVFRPDYPGFATARGVVEAPGGRSHERDTEKRYSHVASKYLRQIAYNDRPHRYVSEDFKVLVGYLKKAHARACDVARALCVPAAFMPSFAHSALRVLEYPPGAGSHVHTDFSLFTLMCYRDQPDHFVRHCQEGDVFGADRRAPEDDGDLDPMLHLGELAELLGLGSARCHSVLPSESTQHSIVYFTIPDHAAVLPGGTTVGAWIEERKERSRYKAAP